MRGDPAERFVRSWRRKIFVYEVSVLVPFVLILFLVAPRLLVVLFLLATLGVVLAGERWFIREMRRASSFVWSDASPVAPIARFPGLGLTLLPNQPSGFLEASLGRPFVWRPDAAGVVVLERDTRVDDVAVLGELVVLSFLDPARAVLLTYGEARPMMFQPRRVFLQSTGTPMDLRQALELHLDALGRLLRAGLRSRPVESPAVFSLFDEFAIRLPSLAGAGGIGPNLAARQRAAHLRRPVWAQRDYRRRLEHCLAAAPDRLPRSP